VGSLPHVGHNAGDQPDGRLDDAQVGNEPAAFSEPGEFLTASWATGEVLSHVSQIIAVESSVQEL
jgi:hypothetical protein